MTTRDVAAAGLPRAALRTALRRSAWVPLLRGSYLVRPELEGPALERAWARSAVLTVRGAVAGVGTAARLHGLSGVPLPHRTQVVVPVGAEVHQRPDLEPHAFALTEGDVVRIRGLPATAGVRTLAHLVPALRRLDALAVLDSALRTGLVDAGGLRRAAELARGRRGSLAVQDLWALADARAESPLESRVRLRCAEGGCPPDDLQVLLRDEHGRVVARGDLGFRRRSRSGRGWLVLEADGQEVHSTPDALYRDRWRADALVALGHDVIRCTWADTLSPERVPSMVRAAL